MRMPRLDKVFVLIAGGVLAVTGLAKIWTAFGDVKLLNVIDPILGIQFRDLMLAVGVAELVIAGLCLFGRASGLATALVAWLAGSFFAYRVGLWWIDWHKPCGCLGNLTDALHISPETADNIIKAVLAYLLIGSYGLLLWRWKLTRENVDVRC